MPSTGRQCPFWRNTLVGGRGSAPFEGSVAPDLPRGATPTDASPLATASASAEADVIAAATAHEPELAVKTASAMAE